MKHKEGMLLNNMEESLLGEWGILANKQGDESQPHGMSVQSIQLLVQIASAGEGGLTRSRVSHDLKAEFDTHLLPLEVKGLVEWEKNNKGQNAYMVLTWRGKEAIESARPRPKFQTITGWRKRMIS